MTPGQTAQLADVNTGVNSLPYDAVPAPFEEPDVWKDAPNGGSWVCRDYVLKKSEMLQALGWPQSAMTVVTCWTETNEHHAVLAVDTDEGTMILDSRFPAVYPISSPPAAYRWESRQVVGTVEFQPVA